MSIKEIIRGFFELELAPTRQDVAKHLLLKRRQFYNLENEVSVISSEHINKLNQLFKKHNYAKRLK